MFGERVDHSHGGLVEVVVRVELTPGEVFFCATQKVFATIVVVEVQGVFSLPPVVEYAGGRGSFGGVIPVGTPGYVAPGTRWWRWALIIRGFEVLLAMENGDGVRGEKEAVWRRKVVLDVDAHGGERSGGGSRCLI